MNDEEKQLYRIPIMERVLRRSYVKRRIVRYLDNHGFGCMSEIAHNINVTPTNVCGAIRGMNNRYNRSDSLLELGIISVDIVKRDNEKMKVYFLTPSGKDAVKICTKLDREVMS